jgi:hypothetical protein
MQFAMQLHFASAMPSRAAVSYQFRKCGELEKARQERAEDRGGDRHYFVDRIKVKLRIR